MNLMIRLAKSCSSVGARWLQLPGAASGEVQRSLLSITQALVCRVCVPSWPHRSTQAENTQHKPHTHQTESLFAQEGRNGVNEATGQAALVKCRAQLGKCNDQGPFYFLTLFSFHAWSSINYLDPSLFPPLVLLQTSISEPCTVPKCSLPAPHNERCTPEQGPPSVCEVTRELSPLTPGVGCPLAPRAEGLLRQPHWGLGQGLCPCLGYWSTPACPEVLSLIRSLCLWWLALNHIS